MLPSNRHVTYNVTYQPSIRILPQQRRPINGPKTEEGKARSSQNSLKHGLNSDKILVLHTEKQEDYDALRAAYLKRFAPQDEVELELVDEMVGARWRLRRIRAIETETMEMRMEDQDEYIRKRGENPTDSRRQAMAFKSLSDTSQSLNMLSRYETRLQRTYDRAFENLKKIRTFPQPPQTRKSRSCHRDEAAFDS